MSETVQHTKPSYEELELMLRNVIDSFTEKDKILKRANARLTEDLEQANRERLDWKRWLQDSEQHEIELKKAIED